MKTNWNENKWRFFFGKKYERKTGRERVREERMEQNSSHQKPFNLLLVFFFSFLFNNFMVEKKGMKHMQPHNWLFAIIISSFFFPFVPSFILLDCRAVVIIHWNMNNKRRIVIVTDPIKVTLIYIYLMHWHSCECALGNRTKKKKKKCGNNFRYRMLHADNNENSLSFIKRVLACCCFSFWLNICRIYAYHTHTHTYTKFNGAQLQRQHYTHRISTN